MLFLLFINSSHPPFTVALSTSVNPLETASTKPEVCLLGDSKSTLNGKVTILPFKLGANRSPSSLPFRFTGMCPTKESIQLSVVLCRTTYRNLPQWANLTQIYLLIKSGKTPPAGLGCCLSLKVNRVQRSVNLLYIIRFCSITTKT